MKNLLCFLAIISSFYSFSQEIKKDTLFIEYDNSFLNREQVIGDKDFMYRIKGTGNDGFVYFLEDKIYGDLRPKNILCFKTALKESNSYYKKDKIGDSKLAEYLGKYEIFLVKENECIRVLVVYEIE